jgi:hypothetical protein
VFQAQRDVARARTLEIQATWDDNKSLVDFETGGSARSASGTALTSADTGALQLGTTSIIRP